MLTKTLATTTLVADASSVTFSGISTEYKDLILITSIRGVTSPQFAAVTFNNNTNNVYINCYNYMGNATTSPIYSSVGSLRDYLAISITSSATNSNETNNAITYIFDYNSSNKWKTTFTETNDTSKDYYGTSAGSFQSTSPITSVTVKHDSGNLGAGTKVTLLGVVA